jgi:hypothetical protein
MRPQEVHVSDVVACIADTGVYIHTCVRSGGHAVAKVIEYILLCSEDIVLHAHLVNGKRDKEVILAAYKACLHRIRFIIWDDVSRPGIRADVRYYGFPMILQLFRKSVKVLDDDLKCMYIFEDEWKGKTPVRRPVDGQEAIYIMNSLLEKSHSRGKLLASVKETRDYQGSNGKWAVFGTVRSGVFLWNLDLVRAYIKMHLGWNPFYRSHLIGMPTNEDIHATGILRDQGLLDINYHISFEGDRQSHKLLDYGTVKSCAAVLAELSPRVGSLALQKKVDGKYGCHGNCASLKDVGRIIRSMKKAEEVKTLDFFKYWDEIFRQMTNYPSITRIIGGANAS